MSEKMPRTASSQAMLSIFSAYDEDEAMEDDKISGSEDEVVLEEEPPAPKLARTAESDSRPSTPLKARTDARLTKLVSYGAEEIEDDEEEEEEQEEEEQDTKPQILVDYDMSYTQNDLNVSVSVEKTEPAPPSDMRLPPEPPGKCSKQLQQKIASYYEKMMRTGQDLSAAIERRKDFRNPSIYEKLIHFIDIDEKGTNYPPSLFDPALWGPESFFEQLAKQQKEEMDKREKERKDKTKIEFVTGTKKALDGSDKQQARRSKWDAQPAGGAAKPPGPLGAAPPGVAANPTIATAVAAAPSGTKTTVIPASGSLKKPK